MTTKHFKVKDYDDHMVFPKAEEAKGKANFTSNVNKLHFTFKAQAMILMLPYTMLDTFGKILKNTWHQTPVGSTLIN